ncbi:uncharacterized protein BN452_00310 [Clostridium sp. CAG:1013]|nr:uncharacterized protein BN452_00310 [Clostridium sp. CAG:1013]
MTPPQLTGDAPVLDVLHPVVVGLFHTLGDEANGAVLHHVNGGAGQGLHLHEPLSGHTGLHHSVAALAGTHIVLDGLDLNEVAALFQILNDLLTGIQTGHTGVLATVFVDGTVLVHHVDDGQVVALAHLEVVGVVGGGNLHHASAEVHFHVLVGDHRDLTAHQGQDHVLAHQVLVPLVLGMDCHGSIAQHGLRTGGSQFHIAGAVGQRIPQVPEGTFLLLEFHLRVRDGGLAVGAPVDDPLAPVDQALVIQLDEHVAHSFGTALVHGKTEPVPVAGRTQQLQLFQDAAAELILPGPGTLQETVAAQILFGESLFPHGFHDLGLSGDGSVVCAGEPQSRVPLHPLPPDEDVLQGLVPSVAHMQLPSDVGRGNDNSVGLFLRIGLGVEIAALHPEVVDAAFHLLGLVGLGKLFAHGVPSK